MIALYARDEFISTQNQLSKVDREQWIVMKRTYKQHE